MDRRKGIGALRVKNGVKTKGKAERAIPKKSPPCFFSLGRCYVMGIGITVPISRPSVLQILLR